MAFDFSLIPHTTQVPNVLLDKVLPKLKPAPLKILLVIIRFTYGFQKESDRISYDMLSKKTGLSRRQAIKGVKELGNLVKTKPGTKGRGWEATNEYSLNLSVITGELMAPCGEPQFTSEVECTSAVLGKDVVNYSSPSQTNIKPNMRAPKSRTPKSVRGDSPVEGFKEVMGLYHDLFVAKVGAKPDIDARDGKILSGLLKGHGVDEVKGLLAFFFEKPSEWVVKNGKFTIPTFKGLYSELLARVKQQQPSMRNIG